HMGRHPSLTIIPYGGGGYWSCFFISPSAEENEKVAMTCKCSQHLQAHAGKLATYTCSDSAATATL
ncbi:hypothetical protein, partial [Acetonema longum]|uniref:hypothetical protein n=1 Tax=Acetonema longum TaxID=2374 RepID=UPI001EE65A7E